MTFSFDIDLEEYDLYDNGDFKNAIKNAAIENVVNNLWHWAKDDISNDEIKSYTRSLLKKHEQDIFNEVVKRITENAEKKKAIKELSPSVRDIQTINRENEKYFMELIDKAIAKRFK